MRQFKFTGEAPVDVPALGITVEPGQTVKVGDAEVSAGLDGQSQWEHIPEAKAAKKATPAPED